MKPSGRAGSHSALPSFAWVSNSNFLFHKLTQKECMSICNRVPQWEENDVCRGEGPTLACVLLCACVCDRDSLKDVDKMCRRVSEWTCVRLRGYGK